MANRQVARSNETSGADPRLLEPCRGRYLGLGVHVPAPCGGHCARMAEQRGHATGRKVETWIGNDGCVLEAKKGEDMSITILLGVYFFLNLFGVDIDI